MLSDTMATRPGYLKWNSRLRYSCEDNYEMLSQPSGMLSVQCTETGEWSDPLPQCSRKFTVRDMREPNY